MIFKDKDLSGSKILILYPFFFSSLATCLPVSRLITLSFEIPPEITLSDRDLVQLICAFRIFNHELEISISTRESSELRNHLLPLGVTTMSAGSKTNPGGYGEDSVPDPFPNSVVKVFSADGTSS